MSNIIKLFKEPQDDAVMVLESLLEKAKRGEFTQFTFACVCQDGCVATAYANADLGTRATLISHMQCDIVYSMIEANMDRLVGV